MKTNQRPRRVFEPQQKITAVLSIWSERRTSAQVCQETFHQPDAVGPVAEPGHRGHAQGPGSHKERSVAADQPAVVAADRKEAERTRQAGEAAPINPEGSVGRIVEDAYGQATIEPPDGAAQSRDDHEGSLRPADCPPGRRPDWASRARPSTSGSSGDCPPFWTV
jgi:hypothetical protein